MRASLDELKTGLKTVSGRITALLSGILQLGAAARWMIICGPSIVILVEIEIKLEVIVILVSMLMTYYITH